MRIGHALRWIAAGAALCVVALVLLGAVGVTSAFIEQKANKTYRSADEPQLSAGELRHYKTMLTVDLHADSLIWNRNLLERSERGHVDLPRLIDGNVAIQVFSVVSQVPYRTKPPPDPSVVPAGMRACFQASRLEGAKLLSALQMRPVGTWFWSRDLALHQARRLRALVAESKRQHAADPDRPVLELILSGEDLIRVLQQRRQGKKIVGALLALEGAHWIGQADDTVEAIERDVRELFDAGFRMLAPTHRFSNALADAGEGCVQTQGLTDAGAQFIRAAESLGIVVDLAHASERTILEAAAIARNPLSVSHTGIARHCHASGRCSTYRNLSDAAVQAIAGTGGVIGIGFWPSAVGRGHGAIAQAFKTAYDVLKAPDFVARMRAEDGDYDPVDHLALGSDFDGSSLTPVTAEGVPTILAKLANMTDGTKAPVFDDRQIRRIAGINACRLFARVLPSGGRTARDQDIAQACR